MPSAPGTLPIKALEGARIQTARDENPIVSTVSREQVTPLASEEELVERDYWSSPVHHHEGVATTKVSTVIPQRQRAMHANGGLPRSKLVKNGGACVGTASMKAAAKAKAVPKARRAGKKAEDLTAQPPVISQRPRSTSGGILHPGDQRILAEGNLLAPLPLDEVCKRGSSGYLSSPSALLETSGIAIHLGFSDSDTLSPPEFRVLSSQTSVRCPKHADGNCNLHWKVKDMAYYEYVCDNCKLDRRGPRWSCDMHCQDLCIDCATPPNGWPTQLAVGMRVRRGLDWKWGSQDGGQGHSGSVVTATSASSSSWAKVRWDISGLECDYRWGQEGGNFDLAIAELPQEFETTGMTDINDQDSLSRVARRPAGRDDTSDSGLTNSTNYQRTKAENRVLREQINSLDRKVQQLRGTSRIRASCQSSSDMQRASSERKTSNKGGDANVDGRVAVSLPFPFFSPIDRSDVTHPKE